MFKKLFFFISINIFLITSSTTFANLEVKARTAILQDYLSV